MPLLQLPVHVELADGRTFDVFADQRDLSKLERSQYADHPLNSITATQFVGWSVLSRQGSYRGSFEQFADQDAIEVQSRAADDPDSEGEQSADPTPGQ